MHVRCTKSVVHSLCTVTDSRKYRFLFAEDNPSDIFFVERAIKKANLPIQLHIVRNGEEAVNYLCGRGMFADRDRYPLPMLVLSNMKMPKMNGLELLTWIRQQPEFQDLPVVVMSNSDNPDESNQFNPLEACSYMIKPFSPDDLIELE
jgi:CheY-like chemotaxis protein